LFNPVEIRRLALFERLSFQFLEEFAVFTLAETGAETGAKMRFRTV
jgi:hypothetical protein